MFREHPFILILIITMLLVANASLYKGIFTSRSAEAYVFAVEKREVTLLRMPSGAMILIDAGSDASILRALGSTLPPWRRSLDLVILTSDKAAQAGGLPSVESRYAVGPVLHAGTPGLPYGAPLTFDGLSFAIIAPGVVAISSGASSLLISSSTPPGTYPLQ